MVGVVSITIVLAIGPVVLVLIAYQVVQREAVVGGEEVHARQWRPQVPAIDVLAAAQALGKLCRGPGIAAPPAAHRVAEFAVQLTPRLREMAHLIAVHPHDIPCLCNQLRLGQDRVLGHRAEKLGLRAEVVRVIARHCHRQVKTKAVHVHLRHPVAQAVHDQPQAGRTGRVHRIAAARHIEVADAILATVMPVIRRVIQPAKHKGGPIFIPLRRVIVHHVQDHLDASRMQRLHHALELAHHLLWRLCGSIRVMRSEDADGVVAPEVRQPFFQQKQILQKLVHWKKLHAGDPEALQVLRHGWVAHGGIGAAQLGRHIRMGLGKAFHMQLGDHRVPPRHPGRRIVAPVKGIVDDDAFQHLRAVVDAARRMRGIRDGVHVHRALGSAVNRARVGVQQQLAGIEAHGILRQPGAMHPVAIECTGPHLQQRGMP